VFCESIFWKGVVMLDHTCITIDFGENRGRCNTPMTLICPHMGKTGDRKPRNQKRVTDHGDGRDRKRLDCTSGRKEGRLADVQRYGLFYGSFSDRPRQRCVLDAMRKTFTLGGGKEFRII
jgi:hypothetical protein